MSELITLNDLFWVLGEQELGPLELYFAKALKKNNRNVNYINIHKLYPAYWKKYTPYSHRLPRKYDNAIQKKYFKIINDALINKFFNEKPNVVFIYNDCKLLPGTLDLFKKNGVKLIVFLGDDPNYLFAGKNTFLLTVMKSDFVILPDTGWIEGLRMLGINNIIHSPVGTDCDTFFKANPTKEQINKYSADVLFIGTGYFLNSWGIRRAAILNELCGFNFKIFGDKLWYDLFEYFPDLKKHFINQPLSAEEVNIACNCAKIYPVAVNAGVINGVSTRIFDCMASGIFVIAEYRKDLEMFFKEGEIIFYKSKSELRDKTEYFLKNDKERNDIADNARRIVLDKYTLDKSVNKILSQIF